MAEALTKRLRWKALYSVGETRWGRSVESCPIRNEPEDAALGLRFDTGEPPDEMVLLAIAEKYEVTIEVVRSGIPPDRCYIYIGDTDAPNVTYDDA